ncbi:hypothetical protein [Xylocopilactobacillus apicola]|nr:hypothetical protein [Xylocopilactobacillus apicola]
MNKSIKKINLILLGFSFFLLIMLKVVSVEASDNALTPTTTTPRSPGTINNPDGSTLTVPSADNVTTVTNPDGSESDNKHVYNAYKPDGSYPIEAQSGVTVSQAYSTVGVSFLDGTLSLIAVPNFDFGANTLDGKTRFIPLYSDALSSVGDPTNGAFIDTSANSSGAAVKSLRDPSKYRALIVSDSRLPLDSTGKYNGWWVSAHMSVGNSGSLNGSNSNSHVSVPGQAGDDPNPDAGNDSTNQALQFPAMIEFGNGFANSSYTISSIEGGQSGNSTPVSHPATYYNKDSYLKGNNSVDGTLQASSWQRVDSVSNTNADGIPSDNQSTGSLRGLYFPRLSVTPDRNSAAQLTGAGGQLTGSTGRPAVANNTAITTIPMSNSDNLIWGYTTAQENQANNSASTGNGPDSVSNGAWALDFQDRGSAIMAFPNAVTLNRPGTYIYNLYWTLNSGFKSNP